MATKIFSTLFLVAACLILPATTVAQPPIHYLNKADTPPGVIGLRQLERGGPLPGYFQPVEVTAPEGTLVSLVGEGGFMEAKPTTVMAGMLIGHVYRLKISNIRFHEGAEVFPTIEVIDRLYPPPGQEARFPIPVVLTQEELEYALDGRYVMRVIYVEDPATALPVQDKRGEQRYFEIAPGQDAMITADRLGRPVAILRMGSRVPEAQGPDRRFLYEAPPLIPIQRPTIVDRNKGLEEPLEAPPRLGQPSRSFPRLPLR